MWLLSVVTFVLVCCHIVVSVFCIGVFVLSLFVCVFACLFCCVVCVCIVVVRACLCVRVLSCV